MEGIIFLVGVLALVAMMGGLVGFFTLFSSKKDNTSMVQQLERDIETLKVRVHRFEDATKTAVMASAMDESTAAEANAFKPAQTDSKKVAHAIKPLGPNFLEKGIKSAIDCLLGGNTMVRSGVVISFLGVSFLLKFAGDNNFISIDLRLAAVALLGIALLVFGSNQREKRQEYAWAIQVGGIGVLYLTIFAAFKLYALIPASLAFGLIMVVAFLSASIAVLQSALPQAILGFTGGFLVPIFTSTGHGSHVG